MTPAAAPAARSRTWPRAAATAASSAAAVAALAVSGGAAPASAAPATSRTWTAAPAAPAAVAAAGNVGAVHFGDVTLTVETRLSGARQGRVRLCVYNRDDTTVRFVTIRIYNRGFLATRMGAPVLRPGQTYCRTTGSSAVRAARSWVSLRGVEQRRGVYAAHSVPVATF